MVTFFYIYSKALQHAGNCKRTLRDFWLKHGDCEEQLKSWFRETEKATWRNINDLKLIIQVPVF
jgi:mRNA interferase HigB